MKKGNKRAGDAIISTEWMLAANIVPLLNGNVK